MRARSLLLAGAFLATMLVAASASADPGSGPGIAPEPPIVEAAQPQPEASPPAPPAGEPPVAIGGAPQAPGPGERPESSPQRTDRSERPQEPRPAEPAPAGAAPLGPGPYGAPGAMPGLAGPGPRMPAFLAPIYRAAGARYGIPWQLLAAINEVETGYGRNLAVSSAGAVGWMQFMPATWRRWGTDADHDGRRDPYDPVDAIHSAARYLRASGYARSPRRAIFAYNHADWYVELVSLRARQIAGLPGDPLAPGWSGLQGRLRLLPRRLLERQVLADGRIEIYPCGRADIRAGNIDHRVLFALLYLADAGLRPTVTSLTCRHSMYTASGNLSHHASGHAADIAAINGVPVLGHQQPGDLTDRAVRALLRLPGPLYPDELISLFDFGGPSFAMADHADHIHLAFRPRFDGRLSRPRASPARRALAVPREWAVLLRRLLEILDVEVEATSKRLLSSDASRRKSAFTGSSPADNRLFTGSGARHPKVAP